MPRPGDHHRNHSFPPCFSFIHKTSSRHLAPPEPDIDDEPWVHFLTPVNDDYDSGDFLQFTAGILTSSELAKKKPSKFRPSTSKKWGHKVNYHHGSFQRHEEQHGFVENRHDPWSHIVEHDIKTSSKSLEQANQLRPRGRSNTRTLSGHRHSWREPSAEIFTVEEELCSSEAQNEAATELHDIPTTTNEVNNRQTPVQERNDRAKL